MGDISRRRFTTVIAGAVVATALFSAAPAVQTPLVTAQATPTITADYIANGDGTYTITVDVVDDDPGTVVFTATFEYKGEVLNLEVTEGNPGTLTATVDTGTLTPDAANPTEGPGTYVFTWTP